MAKLNIQNWFLSGKNKTFDFSDITNENFERLKKVADELILKGNDFNISINLFFNDYMNGTLAKKYTYNEIYIIFILMADPDALLYKYFIETFAQNKKFKKIDIMNFYRLKNNYNIETNNSLYRKAKKIFTFYNDSLIILEKAYFDRFILGIDLSVNLSIDDFRKLFEYNLDEFKGIDHDRLLFITEMTDRWVSSYNIKRKSLLLAYHLENEPQFFCNPNIEEKLTILILAIDPNLDLLSFYYENSNWDEIKKFSIEHFGFFSKQFLNIEKKYNKQYKVISDDPFMESPKIKVNTYMY